MGRDDSGTETMVDHDTGFTLVELLVVVLILGILAALAIPVFLGQREKAFRSAAASDVRNASLTLETYAADHGQWTADLGAVGWSPSAHVVVEVNVYGNGYCLHGSHRALDDHEAWIFNATASVASAAVLHHDTSGSGNCPSGALSTRTVTG